MENSNIEKLANLSRIIITKEAAKKFQENLDNVMRVIDMIKELDCSSIDPLTSVSSMKLRTRADKVVETNATEGILSNAPGKNAAISKDLHYFNVPKVIE